MNSTGGPAVSKKSRENFTSHIYWLSTEDFATARTRLRALGFRLVPAISTPCEVLRARGSKLVYATPSVFNRVCTRQGSWYRTSNRAGMTLLASQEALPAEFERWRDVGITLSDFEPERLPTVGELVALVESESYRKRRPDEWERPGIKDSVLFKTMFTLTGFWGWGDNMRKHWLGHRANHANFLDRRFAAELDGERVPYSVTGNDGVCSSCVEFFNVTSQGTRKLVRSCPGAVTFAGMARDVYYDVQPVPRTS